MPGHILVRKCQRITENYTTDKLTCKIDTEQHKMLVQKKLSIPFLLAPTEKNYLEKDKIKMIKDYFKEEMD